MLEYRATFFLATPLALTHQDSHVGRSRLGAIYPMIDWWIFSKTYKIRCPDGRIAMVYKNIDHAFPFAINEREIKTAARGSSSEIAQIDIAVEYRQGVGQILYAIDDLNSSQIMDFRASYLAYMTDPCSRSEFLQRSIERIRQERNDLIRLRMQAKTLVDLLQNSPDRLDQILPLYEGLLGALRVENDVAEASAAIRDARANAEIMTGGSDGG